MHMNSDQIVRQLVKSKPKFRLVFVVVPFVACGIVPTIIFGIMLNQWGSNLLWGSYFGLGWCLMAFWSGGLVHCRISTDVGLLWGWLALVPLYFFASWLWERTSEHGRKLAVLLLAVSTLPMVPAKVLMGLDEHGIHLPDYNLHLNESF